MEVAHWVGGNPRNGEVYGYASWSKAGGTLSIRNPKTTAQAFTADIGTIFNLPTGQMGVGKVYELKSPWKEDSTRGPITLTAGTPYTFNLAGLETMQFSAIPKDVSAIHNGKLSEFKGLKGSMNVRNGSLLVEFSTASRISTRLEVYGLNGKLVYSVNHNSSLGLNRILWNGKPQSPSLTLVQVYTAVLYLENEMAAHKIFIL